MVYLDLESAYHAEFFNQSINQPSHPSINQAIKQLHSC